MFMASIYLTKAKARREAQAKRDHKERVVMTRNALRHKRYYDEFMAAYAERLRREIDRLMANQADYQEEANWP